MAMQGANDSLESDAREGVNHDFWQGWWRLADPKISLASFASMFLGACAAAWIGEMHFRWLLLTVLGIFAIEVAKNASGEIFDFDSGADLAVSDEHRSPFSGGKRVLVDGYLTRRETGAIAWAGYVIGAAAGLFIVFTREPGILWIGLIGLACAYFYHAPPVRLSYRGWGELAVGVCYGPLIAAGTCLVQIGAVPVPLILASIPLGMLIAAFLWINEFPDRKADAQAGKRTLVVRLGPRLASHVFAGIFAIAFLWLGALPWMGLPWSIWLGWPAAVTGFLAAQRLRSNPHQVQAIIPAQGLTLLSFLLYAAGCGIGFLISS